MGRVVGFAVLAGAEVGAAAGAPFTLIGATVGLVAGAVLGLLSGTVTALLWPRKRVPGTAAARWLVMVPAHVVLGAAVAGIVVLGESPFIGGLATVVALPLTAALTWCSAPWLRLAWVVDPLAEADAWRRTRRAACAPLWVIALTTLGGPLIVTAL